MVLESPENHNSIFSIAPAEEDVLQKFLDDTTFEETSFPNIFCDHSTKGYYTNCDAKLT